MIRKFGLPLPKFDLTLLIVTILLVILGLFIIQSSVLVEKGAMSNLTSRQILAALIGFILLFIISSIDYRYFYFVWPVSYFFSLLLLLLLLLFGEEIRGATRWFILGPFQFQPGEYVKVLLLVSFAGFFTALGEKINSILGLLASIVFVSLPLILFALQPSLGTVLIIALVWAVMLLISPVKPRLLLFLVPCSLFLVPCFWFFLADYQKTRIISFLNPASDPLGTGYNVIQSIIAVGSGQFFGRGWGRGTQSHLRFLPEHHTDFVFAMFCEEMGFLGATVLFLLFGILVYKGLKIAQNSSDFFGSILATGVVVLLVSQFIINVGMNIGLAPISGIPLPLISYGGNSQISTLAAIGLLESIALHSK